MENLSERCSILHASDIEETNLPLTVKVMNANPNKFYLLAADWNTNLCYVVDDLSKASGDETLLTRIRMAYDMRFDVKTVLKEGNTNDAEEQDVGTLSELLGMLNFNENLVLNGSDYHVIVDDIGSDTENNNEKTNRLVARLFQQIIFLNLDIDIVKRSEIKKSLVKDRFRSNYKELRAEIEALSAYLACADEYGNLSESGKSRIVDIQDALKTTIAELQKAKKRPIRIAAMGTKKAGKSVVINSLLKRDYAPTSSELPTPNTIKYIPAAPDEPLTLEYDGKKLTFAKPEDLSDYIGDQFIAAQKITGAGAGLGDMTIYYPSDDLNGYEVWDTPGPNVAFTEEHRKNAEECIKQVDVCIFVMNYSNHLTNDEVNFLTQIRDVFKENNKFYSLFITVNRIDERYAAEVEKSVNRILDYIGGRLEQMQYNNIVIFGTSALQSFYLDKVIKLVKADGYANSENDHLIDAVSIRQLKRSHKEAMTPIRFVESSLMNLEDFHGVYDATEKELEVYSGVPQLWRYVKYIGGQKADMEIVDSVISRCEMQFSIIKNALNITEYQNLTEDAKKYLDAVRPHLDELNSKAQKFTDEMDNWIGCSARQNAQDNAEREIDSTRNAVKKEAKDNISSLIASANISSEDVKKLAQNQNVKLENKLKSYIDDVIDGMGNTAANNISFLLKNIAREQRDIVSSGINEQINEITDEVKKVNELLDKSGVPEITLPDFPVEISLPTPETTKMSNMVSLQNIAQQSVHEVKHTGIKGWFGNWFGLFTEKEGNVQQFKQKILENMSSKCQEAVENTFSALSYDVEKNIDIFFDNFQARCSDVSSDYQKIFKNTSEDINYALDETSERKMILENNIKTLNDVKDHLQPFFDAWDKIRNPEAVK